MASHPAEDRPWAPTTSLLGSLRRQHRRSDASLVALQASGLQARGLQANLRPAGALPGAFLEPSFAAPWGGSFLRRHAPSAPFAASGILGEATSLFLPTACCERGPHMGTTASSPSAHAGPAAPWAALLDARAAQQPRIPLQPWATAHCDASQPPGAPPVDPWEPRPQLKPVLGALQPLSLLGTFLRCQLLAYLPLVEDCLASDVFQGLEEEEGEEEGEDGEKRVRVGDGLRRPGADWATRNPADAEPPEPPKRDWLRPFVSGCYMTIRECLAQTLRRLIERFLVPRVSNKTACDLTRDTWKLAHEKATSRDKTYAASGTFLSEVFVASLKGHFLGSLSGLLIQLVIDLNDYRAYFVRNRLRIRNHPPLLERRTELLWGRLAVHLAKSCGALAAACAGAALGSLLRTEPGTLGGFNIGYLLGDTAGATLVDRITDPHILRLRKALARAEADSDGAPAAAAAG